MAAKGGGESRTGLVVFLVLFILLSIGLGVTTYYGYQEADKQKADAVKAQADAKAWENDSNWYKTVADTYRLYLGTPVPAGDDIVAFRKEYGSEAGAKDKAKAERTRRSSTRWTKTRSGTTG